MSEGEFKKRLNLNDSWDSSEVDKEAVSKLLNEAKKEIFAELLKETSGSAWKKDAENYPGEPMPQLALKLFKWFGTECDVASMPQATYGCVGHIDLEKLQDIEKE